jgi:hypothetical protein
MAKFRMVHTEFWDDPKVVEEMTPEDKFFFLYLLTNSNTTQIGIYQITKKQMAFDIGYSQESINSLLERFIHHHKIVIYNISTRELAIKNWGRYNFNKGGKPVIDCVNSELKAVKDISLIQFVGERIDKDEIRKLYESYYDTSTTGGQEEEKEEEKEKEEEEEKKPSRPKQVYDEQSIHYQLALRLYQNILANNENHKKPDLKKWANDVRLMMERDKRTEDQVIYLMDWCQNDAFWKKNILSPFKLREKFDQLVITVKEEMKKKNLQTSKGNDVPRAYQSLKDWADEDES